MKVPYYKDRYNKTYSGVLAIRIHMKRIVYIPHVFDKIEMLQRHGFVVTTDMIEQVVRHPERLEPGRQGRMVAQHGVSVRHVLRVVYEELDHLIIVTTLYPGRKDRYESNV